MKILSPKVSKCSLFHTYNLQRRMNVARSTKDRTSSELVARSESKTSISRFRVPRNPHTQQICIVLLFSCIWCCFLFLLGVQRSQNVPNESVCPVEPIHPDEPVRSNEPVEFAARKSTHRTRSNPSSRIWTLHASSSESEVRSTSSHRYR